MIEIPLKAYDRVFNSILLLLLLLLHPRLHHTATLDVLQVNYKLVSLKCLRSFQHP